VSAAARPPRGAVALRAVLFVVLAAAAACVPARRPGPPAARAAAPPPSGADAGPAPAAPADLATLEALAARGPSEMPLMREAARADDALGGVAIPPRSADTCYRALLAASRPVRAWFEDERRSRRGEASTSGGDAARARGSLVPPRGPVCARRGEALRLVVEPQGDEPARPVARAVIWQAP
jgi:hypothetical protein